MFGLLVFACIGALWTSLASLFFAPGPGHGWPDGELGLLGLAGAAGAVAAQFAGRPTGRGRPVLSALAAVVGGGLLLGSWGLLALAEHRLAALVVGVVLLDLARQGARVSQRSLIHGPPHPDGRIASAFMTCYFGGGAVGSILVRMVHARAGWDGVCALGAALALLSCLAGAADVPGVRNWWRRQTRLREVWDVGSASLLAVAVLLLIASAIRLAL